MSDAPQIAAALGTPRCEKCSACGAAVVEDEGVVRYHCVDCSMVDFCPACWEAGPAKHGHPADHWVCRELAGPVAHRLRVLGDSPAWTLHNALSEYAPRPLFGTRGARQADGTRAYKWITYEEVRVEALRLAWGLRAALAGEAGDAGGGSSAGKQQPAVGICGGNRVEWLLADFACAFNHYVSVGLHATWPPNELEYVLTLAEVDAVFCDAEHVPLFVAAHRAAGYPRLIVSMDDPVPTAVLQAAAAARDDSGSRGAPRLFTLRSLVSMALAARDPTLRSLSGVAIDSPVTPRVVRFRVLDEKGEEELPQQQAHAPPQPQPQQPQQQPAEPPPRCRRPGCSNFAAAGAMYSLSSHKVRVRGPPGYCNRCYSAANDVPELVAHRAATIERVEALRRAERDLLFSLVFSSGSSGMPKGCMLLHSSWNSTVAGANTQRFFAPLVTLSYAPLGHAMDRMMVWQTLTNGGRVGFAVSHADFATLTECAREVRPVLFVAMPDFWNALYAHCSKVLRELVQTSATPESTESELLALRRRALAETAQLLGGRLALVGTGGAPISSAVLSFMRDCLGCPVVNAYGTTEAGGIASNGRLGSDVRLSLRDVPRAGGGGYLISDVPYPRGEIAVQTDGMIGGYYRAPERTRETFVDGWCLTGDVGELEPGGYLRIIDRRNNLVELYFQGRSVWVAPEPLQTLFASSTLVSHVFLHGERTLELLVAVVVLRADFVAAWTARPENWPRQVDLRFEPLQGRLQLARCEDLRRAVQEDFARIARENSLPPYETPTRVVLEATPWTAENGMLTPTGKLARRRILERYRAAIDAELTAAAEHAPAPAPASASDPESLTPHSSSAPPRPSPPPPLRRLPSKARLDQEVRAAIAVDGAFAMLCGCLRRALRARGRAEEKAAPEGKDELERETEWRRQSAATIARGNVEVCAHFALLLQDEVCASREVFTLHPPLEYLLATPLEKVAEELAMDCSKKLLSGWSVQTEDEVVKRLDADTFLAACPPQGVRERVDLAEARTTLLLGANSFVGAHFVAAWLDSVAAENAHESLNPLVLLWESEDSDASPEEQLRAELVRLRLWQGRFEAWLSDAAVLAVLATPSVALPSFGLQAAVYQRCVRAASRVVVLSEEADFAMPYEALRVRNVEPLRQAVLFAAASEPPKRVHFLSSAQVFAPRGLERYGANHPTHADQARAFGEDEPIGIDARTARVAAADGFAQSKWVAERLLQRAASTLGVPASVYRAPLAPLSGPDAPAVDARNPVSLLLQATLALGVVPALEGELAGAHLPWACARPLSHALVDFVARHEPAALFEVHHLEPCAAPSLFLDAAAAALGLQGGAAAAARRVSLAEFAERLAARRATPYGPRVWAMLRRGFPVMALTSSAHPRPPSPSFSSSDARVAVLANALLRGDWRLNDHLRLGPPPALPAPGFAAAGGGGAAVRPQPWPLGRVAAAALGAAAAIALVLWAMRGRGSRPSRPAPGSGAQ